MKYNKNIQSVSGENVKKKQENRNIRKAKERKGYGKERIKKGKDKECYIFIVYTIFNINWWWIVSMVRR